jgi:ribonuclease HII
MKHNLDSNYYRQGYQAIAGCDEAGRGPLAGPVVAGAVILPKDFHHPLINDSKQLTSQQRQTLFTIIQTHALAWSYTLVDVATIDRINILEASRLAMLESLKKLTHRFDVVLTDAMAIHGLTVPVFPIIRGDALSQTIAASSIIAKVIRDTYMLELDQQYPHYEFRHHKGYPTPKHQQLLLQYGPIKDVHRLSFAPVKRLIKKR